MYQSGEIPRSFFPLQYQNHYQDGNEDYEIIRNRNILELENKQKEFLRQREEEIKKGNDNSKKREGLEFLEDKKQSNLFFLYNIIDKHQQVRIYWLYIFKCIRIYLCIGR